MNLLKHTSFQRWANKRIAEQIQSLPRNVLQKEFGGSFPTIHLTMLHMLQADYRWLHRLKGNPKVDIPEAWSSNDSETILETWLDVQDQLVNRVQELTLEGDVPIKFTTADGNSNEMPLSEIVTHVVNHASYHRGQLVNMLRMAGATPASTDYILFAASYRH